MNAVEVAKYFIETDSTLSEIQLQKLTYYAYSWYMVLNNKKKLFDEQPQAWVHGPVFRSLYDYMRNYDIYKETLEKGIDIDEEIKNFLNKIYKIYGRYSGNELEQLTHSEEPWKKARGNLGPWERSMRNISDEDIVNYYGN